MNDKEIIKLEEKIAYLQSNYEELNMTVFRQQERIEKLSQLVKDIDNNINNSKTLSADEDSDDKDKPPHY
jgi:uncharacterized coiled-coil protein SlyX